VTPDILVAGHIVRDILPGGWRPGGGVYYASCQAAALGLRVGAVTACSAEFELPRIRRVGWHVVASSQTTTFENTYSRGVRHQRVRAARPALNLADIPEQWQDAPVALLTPVFHDLDPHLPKRLGRGRRLLGIGAQGWLRRREGETVHPGVVEPRPSWLAGDVVFVSEEDVTEPEAVAVWQRSVPVIVLTRAGSGCTIWDASGRHDFAPVEIDEVDPTGAGDVFAVAFLHRYRTKGRIADAARFAAAAAALAIRGKGAEGVAGTREIEGLIRRRETVEAR
jgi:pfkB family carbohydrate kinase